MQCKQKNAHVMWCELMAVRVWAETASSGSHLLHQSLVRDQPVSPSTQNILIPGISHTHHTSGSKRGRDCHKQSSWSLASSEHVQLWSSGAWSSRVGTSGSAVLCCLPGKLSVPPGSCCCSQLVFLVVVVVVHRFAPYPALIRQPPMTAVGFWGIAWWCCH